MVSITHALELIYKHTAVLPSEILPIEEALGRVMSQDSIASFDLPRFDNSAMDGYAVKCEDALRTVPCTAVIYAGDNPQMQLQAKEVIKIMTGAPIPQGCEAIVPIECCVLKDQDIQLPSDIKPNAHIRRAGEDVKAGTIYLKKGQKVSAYAIALLASQGVTHINVTRAIKVAVFGTGDELRPHYEKIQAQQLYNSNTPMFLARAKALGCEVHYISASGDSVEALQDSIRLAQYADLIITSGGVSMGDKDFTKEAFTSLGMEVFFDKINIKPGKPTVFGKLHSTMVINLAGNPLASMVNYEIFVRACLRKLSGASDFYHQSISVALSQDFRQKKGKFSVILGKFDGKGFLPLDKQQAGMLSPLPQADAMILSTDEIDFLPKGSLVKMLPIAWELTSPHNEDIFTR